MFDELTDLKVRKDAEKLVSLISHKWPSEVMGEINNDLEYGQYSEVVLDVLAIAIKKNFLLIHDEKELLHSLVTKMKIQDDVLKMVTYLINEKKNNNIPDLNIDEGTFRLGMTFLGAPFSKI